MRGSSQHKKKPGPWRLQAGVDLNITYEPAYMGPLVPECRRRGVPVSLVDLSVRRLLREKFRLGLFEHPYVDPNQSRAHRALSGAFRILPSMSLEKGIVLLKNEQNLLPLKKNLTSIA